MLCQRLPSFQSPVPDIDLQSSRERIRASGSPSSLEHVQISQIIAEAEKDLSDYEEDLRLESIRSDLRKKRDDLQTYVDDCKAYLSPIRQLPIEIMGEIFLFYQDLHGTRKDGRFREPINDPDHSTQDLTALMLSSVCKLWHSICLCTPQLWSRFSLDLDLDEKERDALSHLLPIYLSRSKQMSLCFDIKIQGDPPAPTKSLSLLVAQSHRWFSTTWVYDDDMVEETVACLGVQKELPLLQHIAVKPIDDYVCSGDLLSAFARACTPRTVSLTWMSNFLDLKLPWSEVHFLRAREVDIATGVPEFLAKLAGQCHALRSFEVHFSDNVLYKSAQLECSIHLDALEYLCLDAVSWSELGEFFSISTLPNLRRLALDTVSVHNDTHTPNIDSFRSFVSRSQCQISVLQLRPLRFDAALDPICDMIHHLPALKKLILAEKWTHPGAIMLSLMETLHVCSSHSIEAGQGADSLTTQHNDPVLPLLEELVMEVRAEGFQASNFVDMVKSRRSLTGHGIRALKSVRLYLQWSYSTTDFTVPPILQSLECTDIDIISSMHDSRRFLRDEHQECWPAP
ncbi:hypothetical protein D9758_009510 [Tetrapyrgos nigripes]|uniref:F-box domain-containing protein n=1 Tax=Tetrapyrgos nigripes TaxID=182062 RepID=A0A8H5G1A0_9AGAR|nr:hypothetical protein D9758_009510 [Tetrapyrgos nigripes]